MAETDDFGRLAASAFIGIADEIPNSIISERKTDNTLFAVFITILPFGKFLLQIYYITIILFSQFTNAKKL